jgi:hypothetical protein
MVSVVLIGSQSHCVAGGGRASRCGDRICANATVSGCKTLEEHAQW